MLTHQYTAEYGGSSGVIVNAVTKSGAQPLRGRGFYYFQDDELNATDYFLKQQGEENPESGSNVLGLRRRRSDRPEQGVLVLQPRARRHRERGRARVSARGRAARAELLRRRRDQGVEHLPARPTTRSAATTPSRSAGSREAAINIGEEWEDALALPESVEVENDEGDQVFNFNWTKVIGTRATNELKVVARARRFSTRATPSTSTTISITSS